MRSRQTDAIRIMTARDIDLPVLSELCIRSKGHWGYDRKFLDLCRRELTLRSTDLETSLVAKAVIAHQMLGVVQLIPAKPDVELAKLFVLPEVIGIGVGRRLFGWAVTQAQRAGIRWMAIESDPHACGFYRCLGAVQTGWTPSHSIPGRRLPLLRFDCRKDSAAARRPRSACNLAREEVAP